MSRKFIFYFIVINFFFEIDIKTSNTMRSNEYSNETIGLSSFCTKKIKKLYKKSNQIKNNKYYIKDIIKYDRRVLYTYSFIKYLCVLSKECEDAFEGLKKTLSEKRKLSEDKKEIFIDNKFLVRFIEGINKLCDNYKIITYQKNIIVGNEKQIKPVNKRITDYFKPIENNKNDL